jgi:predicted AAA+ superfamily ATPase
MYKYFERDIYQKMLEWKKGRETNPIPQSLEISGPRQCGKTTLVEKFSKENYRHVVSINLGRIDDLNIVRRWENRVAVPTSDGGVSDFLHLFSEDFVDSPDTVIVIDEIQVSHQVYQMIRQVTRELKSHLIVTGSYLGEITRNKNFSIPAGDLYKLKLTTLTFEEFLGVFGKRELWESLDLFGASDEKDYYEIMRLFGVYIRIGGYPTVISAYINGSSVSVIDAILGNLVKVFVLESKQYLTDIEDIDIVSTLFESVSRLMLDEKRGTFFLPSKLTRYAFEKHKYIFSKKGVISIINWLVASEVLSTCSFCDNHDVKSLVYFSRLYFTDLGIARFFLENAKISSEELSVVLFENFAFLCLQSKFPEQKLVPNNPALNVYGYEEIDFVVDSKVKNTVYSVIVKANRDELNTSNISLGEGVVNKVLFVKGNTCGEADNGRITIPVYLLSRYDFNEGMSPFSISDDFYVVQEMYGFKE